VTKILGSFYTSDGPQFAIADNKDAAPGEFSTVCVLSETDADGLTAGQMSFKHNVTQGTEQGQFSS
jgi:hypothetical protein